MSNQSEIDRWWRTRPPGPPTMPPRPDRPPRGHAGPALRSPKVEIATGGSTMSGRRSVWTVGISVIGMVLLGLRYRHRRVLKVDQTDWVHWAANAESGGGR